MEVIVKHIDSGLTSEDKKMYNDFIKFINKHYPVPNKLKILFLGEKTGQMSTGSQNTNGEIKVLSKNRLNRDIMRTLAHEWVHAYQRFVLGRERGPDIGGQNEDEANAFAGQLIKMFEKEYPNYENLVFESTEKLMHNVKLINEQLLVEDKKIIKEDFITEMKKIGIEKLPYAYSALNRFVDSETMDVHYNKHYKGYVKKLNDALAKKSYGDVDLEDIIRSIGKYDEKIRNNAGGAFNHALFWKMLSPKKQKSSGEIYDKIIKQYGNIKKLKDEFNEIAKDRFGSGWVWLVLTKNNRLKIMSTPNQDNPLMNIVKDGGYPLLGLDVWEHAYYLRYKNKRDEYIKNFWDCVNWEFVNKLYLLKKKNKEDNLLREMIEVVDDDLRRKMSRELQKIRLIPLDMVAATEAINNIITAEIDRDNLKFNRTISGLMTLDLSTVSERSRFRFNNYFQRFTKSRTRGYDFEGLVAGLLGGTLAESLNSPFDVLTPNNERISCKTLGDTGERITLKSIRKSVLNFVDNYNGSDENKTELLRISQDPKFLYLILTHENTDIRNLAEDVLNYLLQDIDGLLVGVPESGSDIIKLYYYDRNKLIEYGMIPEMLSFGRTKDSQVIGFSQKIFNETPTISGQIQFPTISKEEYHSFLVGDDRSTRIIDLFNTLGIKYGVNGLGDNLPQDIIKSLATNEKFKLDINRLLKLRP